MTGGSQQTDNSQSRREVATAPKVTRSRRVVLHLTQRDWMGIFIELAIVTLGVLLAFQIDQWGQDRRDQRQERQFLTRMWSETSDIASQSKDVADSHEKEAAALRSIVEAGGDPSKLRLLDAQAGGAGCRTYVLPSLGVSDATAEELLNSGRLNVVSDADLRDQLRLLAATQQEAAGQLAYAREVVPMIDEGLGKYIFASLGPSGENTCRVHWSQALADPLAVRAILRAKRIQELMAEERRNISGRALAVHNALACYLHKADCRR